MDALRELCEMKKAGLLSDEEFASAKANLLTPTGEKMNRNNSAGPVDFSLDVLIWGPNSPSCTSNRNLEFSSYIERQWGGRLTETQYEAFVEITDIQMKAVNIAVYICPYPYFECTYEVIAFFRFQCTKCSPVETVRTS